MVRALSNPVGRPPKYNNPEEMQRIIDLYYLACKINRDDIKPPSTLSDEDLLIIEEVEDIVPAISGLAYTLGMATETLRAYGKEDEFSATVKRAKQRVEMSLEQRLAGTAVTGSIFSLKNNFGWKDKTEQEIKTDMNVIVSQDDSLVL